MAVRSTNADVQAAAQRAAEQGLGPSSLMSQEEIEARHAASQVAEHMGLSEEDSGQLQDLAAEKIKGLPMHSPQLAEESLGKNLNAKGMIPESISGKGGTAYTPIKYQEAGYQPPWQEEAGRAADELATAGGLITGAGRGAMQGVGYGARAAGALGKGVGYGLSNVAPAAAEYYGVPEASEKLRDALVKRLRDRASKPMLMSP